MKNLRENLINLLKSGQIPGNEYINHYEKLKETKFEKDDFIQKNIDTLKSYYPNATEDEKSIINNVLFVLEIFNSDENALKNFLFRTLHFNDKLLKNNEHYVYALEFFKNNTSALHKDIFIDILKKILSPHYFFSLDEYRRKAILINILIIWHNENIFMKPFWLKKLPIFKKLIDYAIKNDYIEDAMYSEFFIYHFYGNTSQTIKDWEKFNEMIEKPLSKYFKNWGEKNNLPQPKNYRHKKKKLGFLIDRLVLTSPLMVEYSLWKALMKNEEFKKNYEIYVYSMNYAEKQLDDAYWIKKLLQIGIKFYTPQHKFSEDNPYYNHLAKALDLREHILKDEIDILIGNFGYAIPNFLFSTRTALKQIFWSHGNCTSEIENIDLRISHFEQECKNYDWKTFNVPMAEEFLIGSPEEKTKGEILKKTILQAFGENTVILGSIGRLIKIDSDEYIKTVAEIMKQNPNTIYLACGGGNKENIKEKLKKYNIDENRFIFTGMVNPHVYGWVIDVYLDTFPLIGGNSVEEIKAKGKAIVRLHNGSKEKIYNGIWTLEKIYKEAGNIKKLLTLDEKTLEKINPLLTTNKFLFLRMPVVSKERYIELANIFIRNKDLREEGLNTPFKDLMRESNFNQSVEKFKKILDEINA